MTSRRIGSGFCALLVGLCAGCFGPSDGACTDPAGCAEAEGTGAPDSGLTGTGGGPGFATGGDGAGFSDDRPDFLDGFDAGFELVDDCTDAGGCLGSVPAPTVLAGTGDVRALQLSTDSVYLLEWGTEDALGNQQGDGRIVRMDRADGEPDTLVHSLTKPLDLLLDDTSVLWTERHGDMVEIWAADREDGANAHKLSEGLNLSWAHDATHVYYMTEDGGSHSDPVELFRVEKATGSVEALTDEDFTSAFELEVGPDAVHIFSDMGFLAVPLAGGDATTTAPGPVADIGFAISGDDLVYSTFSGFLRRVRISDGSDWVLAAFEDESQPMNLVPHGSHVYFGRVAAGGTRRIERAWLDPSAPEASEVVDVLATLPGTIDSVSEHSVAFGVDEGGLYWVQQNELLHSQLPDN